MVQEDPQPSNAIPYAGKDPDTRNYASQQIDIKESNTAPKTEKTADKRNLDYLLRSGLAGGIAGVAVRSPPPQQPSIY
jgi:hypothetical protein